MAEDFNPYHVWLGIPPEEQPANQYRLLSLKLFETNGDVIDSAADRQMAHLRTFQAGKYGTLTQRLLNEVAAARICLLDPKKRAAYDQQLRATLPATAAPVSATSAASSTASGSAIHRQPPRRPDGALPTATPWAPMPSVPVAAVLPQPVDQWDELLGDPIAKPAHRPGGRSADAAKTSAAEQKANSRNLSIGIAAAAVLIAAAGIGWFVLNGSSSDGALVFDWPAADRTDTSVTVDNTPLVIPASGPWEYHCPAGPHHIVAQHLAFMLDANVAVAAGQQQTVPPNWKNKATLVLSWPLAMRSRAELEVDGRVQPISQHEPLELPVEPGRHLIQITRPGFPTIGMTAIVAPDGRELVSIAPPPAAAAKLVFDWPVDQRKDAELTVDGRSQTVAAGSDGTPLELSLEPGRHVVHITRTGFAPFNQPIDLAAGANQSVKPIWTPEQKKGPTVAETPAPVEATPEPAPEPAKKLPVPAAAELQRIAKQLDDHYKTSRPGPKDLAKAQEFYDVAAKAGSAPAERYMLLMRGAEIAAAAGDLNLSLQGIDTLDADYEINALEAKQKLLEKFINAGKPDQVAPAIQSAEQLVDEAVAADQYEIALVLATTASRALVKSKIPERKEVEERLTRRRHEIHLLEPIYATAKKAQERLDKNPSDAEANLAVGRWRCLYKWDWGAGLPLLAKGSDEKLKSLAEVELKASSDSDQQFTLAEGWWDLAQKEAGVARDSLHLHAGEIYRAAMPNLASALKKAAIEKRLAEIANLRPIVTTANNSTAAGNSTVAIRFPLNQWVDILRLVDTTKNVVAGKWSRSGKAISVMPGWGSRIAIPVAVEGSYDLEVKFTRDENFNEIETAIPVGSRGLSLMLGGEDGTVSGFDTVDGRRPLDDGNPTTVRSKDIVNGQECILLVKVRLPSTDQASVDVLLNGKPYLPHWQGSPSALAVYGAWRRPTLNHPGLGAWETRATFSSAKLRMISGHALGDASVSATATSNKPMPSEFSSGNASAPSQWMKEVAALPAEQQVEAVVKRLHELNPRFDGRETHKIEGEVVTGFTVLVDNVADISPLHALAGLSHLNCRGSGNGKGLLSDLSPLKGMRLTFLDIGWTAVSDLSPLSGMPLTDLSFGQSRVTDLSALKGMPLARLNCGWNVISDLSPLKGMRLTNLAFDVSHISDLSPLQGMPLINLNCSQNPQLYDLSPLKGMSLTELYCNNTKISNLSPLKGMPLTKLYCDNTQISDLSPLEGMKLNEVSFTPGRIRVGVEILRRMPSIRALRSSPWDVAATPGEFWKKYDAGEFNK
jgi:hypothetical protein